MKTRAWPILTLTLAGALWLTGCHGDIPVVGLDAEGKVIETLVSHADYTKQLSDNVAKMSQAVIPVVDSGDYGQKLSGLRAVGLGLGLSGSVGLGDYWKLGGSLGFTLRFSNKE